MTATHPEAKSIILDISRACGGSQTNTSHARRAKRAVKRLAQRLQEAQESVARWEGMETAPRTGERLYVRYEDGTEEHGVYWVEEGRCCMLGPRAGAYPPGWCSENASGLPVDEPAMWLRIPK